MVGSEEFKLETKVQLRDGVQMPLFGLGVYEMSDSETEQAVKWALEVGYKLIDTAEWYENERSAGKGIHRFLQENPSVPRSEIFYETKLKHNLGRKQAQKALQRSLADCGLEYIDLYLIHSPIGGIHNRKDSWEVALEAKNAGLIKSIGVSNYSIKHLKEIVDNRPPEDWPTVNQIDLHPFRRHPELEKYCKEHNILLQAWAPIARGMRFNHPTIMGLAEKYSKTPAQILLRWCLQKGYAPIPKSARRERIIENAQVFGWHMSDEDMESLEYLNEDLITDWDMTALD
ncbi:hypothetical protein M422DRAFT_244873 [Sphaerobolus stellatus SS14]|nr:hypothetical protein M422DRAFT_244873 [Sphaerobolus stellatus SS14]